MSLSSSFVLSQFPQVPSVTASVLRALPDGEVFDVPELHPAAVHEMETEESLPGAFIVNRNTLNVHKVSERRIEVYFLFFCTDGC